MRSGAVPRYAMRRDLAHRLVAARRGRVCSSVTLVQSALNRKYTRWLLTEPLRRQMSELLGYGLAMKGLVICN